MNASMSVLHLEPSELSYLLQTVNARSVIGVDNAQLFPDDEDENQALLRQGSERLQAHGWLRADSASGKVHFDEKLCYMIAIMADPEYAIVTVRQEALGLHQLITHYLAGQLIVEQVRTPDLGYQLGFVSRLSTAVERIQSVVLPLESDSVRTTDQALIDRHVYRRVKELVRGGSTEAAVAELLGQGIELSQATSLVSTMQMPAFRTAVAVLKRQRERVITTCSLTVMQSQQIGWLIHSQTPDDEQVALETYLPQLFISYLAGCVQRTVTGPLN